MPSPQSTVRSLQSADRLHRCRAMPLYWPSRLGSSFPHIPKSAVHSPQSAVRSLQSAVHSSQSADRLHRCRGMPLYWPSRLGSSFPHIPKALQWNCGIYKNFTNTNTIFLVCLSISYRLLLFSNYKLNSLLTPPLKKNQSSFFIFSRLE